MTSKKRTGSLINYFKELKHTKYFANWSKFDIGWIILSSIVIMAAALYGDLSNRSVWYNLLISLAGTLTGMWCVIAVNKQRLSNYIFGLINVIAFGYLYFSWGMYGMAGLNIFYFIPMQFHGIFSWLKNRKANETDIVNVRWGTRKEILIYLAITGLGILGMFLILKNFQDVMGNLGFITLGNYSGTLLILDAVGVTGNVVAQVLMNRRLIDQWIYWFVIDVSQTIAFGIFVFLNKDLTAISMFVMYLLWLTNAFIGCRHWIKDYKRGKSL